MTLLHNTYHRSTRKDDNSWEFYLYNFAVGNLDKTTVQTHRVVFNVFIRFSCVSG